MKRTRPSGEDNYERRTNFLGESNFSRPIRKIKKMKKVKENFYWDRISDDLDLSQSGCVGWENSYKANYEVDEFLNFENQYDRDVVRFCKRSKKRGQRLPKVMVDRLKKIEIQVSNYKSGLSKYA
jgi:hypothetical protein